MKSHDLWLLEGHDGEPGDVCTHPCRCCGEPVEHPTLELDYISEESNKQGWCEVECSRFPLCDDCRSPNHDPSEHAPDEPQALYAGFSLLLIGILLLFAWVLRHFH